MFRALLWKEWRELWILPAAAPPLAAMTFFLAKPHGPRITADIWEISFFPWLFLAVMFIPTHLYTRDKELDTSIYIGSMPLDRFRLWWVKFFVGLTVAASIGLVLYGTTTILCSFYERAGAFEGIRDNIVVVSLGFSWFVWGLSAVLSSLFRRQRSTLIACSLCLVALWMMWNIASAQFRTTGDIGEFFSRNPDYWAVGFATLSFPLLLAALLRFAGGNLWNQGRATLVLAYGACAVAFATPAVAGSFHLLGRLEEALEPKKEAIWLLDSSADGNMLLVRDRYNDHLFSIDLGQRKAHIITTDWAYDAYLNENRNIISYVERHEWYAPLWHLDSQNIIFSDFAGTIKKNPFNNELTFFYPEMAWSLDGSYLGITDDGFGHQSKHSFIAIGDADGNLLWKRENPLLEDSWSWPIGWDHKSRFYYWKRISKENSSTAAFWRISVDRAEPERLALDITDDYPSYYRMRMSPNGKWIAWSKTFEDLNREELWNYDVSTDQLSMLSENMYSYRWSADGNRLACMEATGEHVEGDRNKSLPTRLTIYDLASGESESIPLGAFTLDDIPALVSWSYSGKQMLFISGRKKHKTHKLVYTFLSLSVTAGEIIEISEEESYGRALRWLPGERILWTDNNRLITTYCDGSNPRELFRVEDGKFYLYGEEQR